MNKTTKFIVSLLLVVLSCQLFSLARADVNCKAVILSPSTNTSYTDIMPLNFTAEWTKGNWTQWIMPRYFYFIDNGSKVSITTEPFPYIDFTDNNPAIEVINDTIDISNLSDGVHTLTLYTNGTVNEANLILYIVNFTLSTTYFQIGSPIPSPTPSQSSNVPSEIIFGLVVLVPVIIVLSVLLYRRHRKTPKTNQ